MCLKPGGLRFIVAVSCLFLLILLVLQMRSGCCGCQTAGRRMASAWYRVTKSTAQAIRSDTASTCGTHRLLVIVRSSDSQ